MNHSLVSLSPFSPAPMVIEACVARRRRLLAELNDSIAIFPAAPVYPRTDSSDYPYRADNHLLYVSAFPEPECCVLLLGQTDTKAARSILFCREKNSERETWEGFRFGTHLAQEQFAFDEVYAYDRLSELLPNLLTDHSHLYYDWGKNPAIDQQISACLQQVRQSRSGYAPDHTHNLSSWLAPYRVIKDASEIQLMQHAADISSAGHNAAMRSLVRRTNPCRHEYQLEAEISHAFRFAGGDDHAYPPIVASGINACTLHYTANKQALNAGDLVLIDAGCEFSGYAADITRTFPVSGRFTPAQKDVYEIVLAAQTAAFAQLKPNVDISSGHQAAVNVIAQGLIDLKLLSAGLDEVIEKGLYRRFYMHNTSHFLGLDVHDTTTFLRSKQADKLKAGMVLTVEPGIYINPSDDIPAELAGIGIRTEDDVLITDDGCRVYTHAAKTVAEIENLMCAE